MKSIEFTDRELAMCKMINPNAGFTAKGKSISLGKLGDKRHNTINFFVYKYPDGYRLRRKIKGCMYSYSSNHTHIYQLNRNSSKKWSAFDTLTNALIWLKFTYKPTFNK